jgi:hypothetical protein
MATLNLPVKEFTDVVMIFLLDQVMNPELIQNEDFKSFIERHSSKLKAPLMKYYLDTDGESRVNYKRIKGVFDGSDQNIQQIRIFPDEKPEEPKKSKKSIVKKIIKKLITKEEISNKEKQMLREIIENDLF